MKRNVHSTPESGTTLVVAICVLTVISVIAAGVLANANARYHVGSKSVKAWKEALYAAEAGGDLAFNEIRKPYVSPTPATASFASGWVQNDSSAPPPNPGSATAPAYAMGYSNSGPAFGTNNNLTTKVTVDKLANLPGNDTVYYYRIRSIGIAQMFGHKRTGMNDALQESSGTHFATDTSARGNGDSLLRKIDYNFDHFLATYGFGDALPSAAATSSNGKASVSVSDPDHGQVTRRIELVAVPVMPIEGAVKTNGGGYNFPIVDSYNSANGAYPGQSCATTPSCTTYADARNGNVVDGSANFNGTVYGDVTTNGGNASKNSVSGVIDNNVPVATIQNWPEPTVFPAVTTQPSTLTPPAVEVAPTGNTPVDSRQQRTFYYHYPSLGNITINPAPALDSTGLGGGVVETYVHIKVDGDVTSNTITVGKGVFLKVYFHGNVSAKANTFDNNNVEPLSNIMLPRKGTMTLSTSSTTMTSTDVTFSAGDVGKQVRGTGIPSGTTIVSVVNSSTVTLSTTPSYTGTQSDVTLGGYTSSTNTSSADHFWMIGEGTNQSINLGSGSPQVNYVVWYAPNADFVVNGNPDFVGAFVVKSMTGNGNNSLHFDKALLNAGTPMDYRIASYVEDIR